VRDICIFFDDITRDAPAAAPAVQADLVSLAAAFLRAQTPPASLCFISSYYAGTADEIANDRTVFSRLFSIPSSAYYAAYAALPRDLPIMWTGPAVFSEFLSVADAAAFRAFVGRPVWVWDNYPVNDGIVANELYLAPYEGREAGLAGELDGVLLNPMLQAEATKIPLWTAGRAFRQGAAYDPWTAWDEALAVASNGRGTAPLRLLAQQFLSHPLIGSSAESPELAAAIAAFWDEPSPASEERLRTLFSACARNRTELEDSLGNPALLAELLEPATKLSIFGEAGLLALDLLAAKSAGGAVDSAALQARLDAAAQIPWLVAANTPMPRQIATLIGRREPRPADVFGNFFARVRTELGG
jgi:hyaluronoglucosaminidase